MLCHICIQIQVVSIFSRVQNNSCRDSLKGIYWAAQVAFMIVSWHSNFCLFLSCVKKKYPKILITTFTIWRFFLHSIETDVSQTHENVTNGTKFPKLQIRFSQLLINPTLPYFVHRARITRVTYANSKEP